MAHLNDDETAVKMGHPARMEEKLNEKKRGGTSLLLVCRQIGMVRLEADAEGDWDVVAVDAVLRKYVEAV
jgi:hypothetical protein